MPFDFHTHNLQSVPGSAIVNLPEEALLCPGSFQMVPGGMYSVGIHPWWTEDDMEGLWKGWTSWLHHPQIVAVGECGLDKLRGLPLEQQEEIFVRQVEMAEQLSLPVIIHCVRAFDRLLHLHKQMTPSVRWTVHGFSGKPTLARQLLTSGFDLSFGRRFHPESLTLTPPERRHFESDDDSDFFWRDGES